MVGDRLDRRFRVFETQAGRISLGVERALDVEIDGVEPADAIAVETADVAGLPVIEQNLIALRGDRTGAQHDAGVRRPIGLGFEHEFEVAKHLFRDQIGAKPAARRLLPSADGAVLDGPGADMGRNPPAGRPRQSSAADHRGSAGLGQRGIARHPSRRLAIEERTILRHATPPSFAALQQGRSFAADYCL